VEAKLDFREYFQVVSQSLGAACWLQVADGALLAHSYERSGSFYKTKVRSRLSLVFFFFCFFFFVFFFSPPC
jgi:hypothetical protein